MSKFEIIGIVGTLFIMLSYAQSNVKILRTINLIGCVLFIVYGVCINSLSTVILNAMCFIVNVFKMIQESKHQKFEYVAPKFDHEVAEHDDNELDLSAIDSVLENSFGFDTDDIEDFWRFVCIQSRNNIK